MDTLRIDKYSLYAYNGCMEVISCKKLSVSLEEKLIDRIDKFAADSGLNCSALIAVACVQYMDACEAAPGLNSLLASLAAFTPDGCRGQVKPRYRSI